MIRDRRFIPLALFLFILPILIRLLWVFPGFYWRTESVSTPDYISFQKPEAPLSTPAAPQAAQSLSGKIVLLDLAHGNRYAVSEIESLTRTLTSRGARLETISNSYDYAPFPISLADKLHYASAYITAAPMTTFTSDEVRSLQEFAASGGRLLVLTDPTRSLAIYDYYGYGPATFVADVESANTLLAPFDLAFADDYLYNTHRYEGNFQNVYFRGDINSSLTVGLDSVVLYSAHSVYTSNGTPILLGEEHTLSSRTAGTGNHAAALDASGNVLAIGDLTFLNSPYHLVADNPLLIDRIAGFLLGSDRTHCLKDFPFIFRSSVEIVLDPGVELTETLFGPLHALQNILEFVGIHASLTDSPNAGTDRILLATYQSKGIQAILEANGVRLGTGALGAEPAMIIIDGIGTVDPMETGLILYNSFEGTPTEILLVAQDSTALAGLLSSLGADGFINCIVQSNIGICGVPPAGSGGNGWEDWSILPDTFTTEPEISITE